MDTSKYCNCYDHVAVRRPVGCYPNLRVNLGGGTLIPMTRSCWQNKAITDNNCMGIETVWAKAIADNNHMGIATVLAKICMGRSYCG